MSGEAPFHAALAKTPATRAAFLDAACAGQPELRAAVEALLTAHAASASLLNQPAVEPNSTGAYAPAPVEKTGVHVPHDAQPGYIVSITHNCCTAFGHGPVSILR